MKIYTRTGDKGKSSLFDGSRVDKSDIRLELLGEIDDLNSHIGVLISFLNYKDTELLVSIQNKLFVAGSEIANPDLGIEKFTDLSEVTALLESQMDLIDKKLDELKNFILPGGCIEASFAHLCRTKTRRIERLFFKFKETHKDVQVNETIGGFLNRLSDFFFVYARYLNQKAGNKDILWKGD